MPKQLWLRIGLVVLVLAASIWYLYPPRRTINLGLDLQGGIHLVLGVDAGKALENQVERVSADVKAALDRKGIAATRVAREGRAVVVQLASPQTSWNDALAVAREFPAYDAKVVDQSAGVFRLELKAQEARQSADLAVRQGLETIRNRVDQFGVAEATSARQGPDREDRPARVQAPRRAGDTRGGARREAAGRRRDRVPAADGQGDEDRAQGAVRGAEAHAPDRRRADARRRQLRPQLGGSVAGGPRVQFHRGPHLRRYHRA